MKSLIRLQVAAPRTRRAAGSEPGLRATPRSAGPQLADCSPTSGTCSAIARSIQSLVARELKARYRGSVLGFFWSFVNPLLLLLIYTFVFTVVLPGAHARRARALSRSSCSAASCRGPGSRRRCSKSSNVADRRRQPDQEGAVSGRGAADRHGARRTSCTSASGCRSSRRFSSTTGCRSQPPTSLWLPVIVLVQLVAHRRPRARSSRR